MKPLALIVGLGNTGVSCARHLAARGWRIAVTDSRAEPPGLAALRSIVPDARLSLGRLDATLVDDAKLVVASPGLASTAAPFVRARERGVEIVGDIELFAREVAGATLGITGTNGKSTVTSLLGAMARRAGIDVQVGGNLGPPALDLLQAPHAQLYVLELSSYQLETTHSLQLVGAAVLNVSADHLDRYADVAQYAAAKQRIFARCGTAVVNADDPVTLGMPGRGQRVVAFSLDERSDARFRLMRSRDGARGLSREGEWLLPLAQMRLAGMHNAANALAALALGEVAGIDMAAMLSTLQDFGGLAHRTQTVGESRGVRYVDDSKGTNVGATLAAVAGLEGPLVIIAGGDGKGQDFRPLAAAFREKVRHCVLIGRDAASIEAVLQGICGTERAADMRAAVAASARAARPGDTVLLSPACASLDMFESYAHRGAAFARAVAELAS